MRLRSASRMGEKSLARCAGENSFWRSEKISCPLDSDVHKNEFFTCWSFPFNATTNQLRLKQVFYQGPKPFPFLCPAGIASFAHEQNLISYPCKAALGWVWSCMAPWKYQAEQDWLRYHRCGYRWHLSWWCTPQRHSYLQVFFALKWKWNDSLHPSLNRL